MKTLLLSLFASVSCIAHPVTISWDAYAVPPLEYRIYRVTSVGNAIIATVKTNSANIELESGDVIRVSAYDGVESELSDALMVEFVEVTMESSEDLTNWRESFKKFCVKRSKQFYRLKIEQ